MGESSLVSPASGAIDTNDPVLYIEFRKDGGSIDPGPWWAKSQSEKVRG
jgi:septal ring factor EnvC (AmiA/AmiB activator)